MSTTLEAIRSTPRESALLSMAVGIVIDRVNGLSPDDREDLFKLVKAIPQAESKEDMESIYQAMLEILEADGGHVIEMPASSGKTEKLDRWKSHVGMKTRRLRKSKGWTQEELAKQSGLPQSHISRIEQEQLSPSSITIDRLAHAFGVSVGDIDPSR